VSAKLATDGTLTEGSVQRDDEFWNTVLTTIGTLVGDFTGVGAAPAATQSQPAVNAALVRAPSCPAQGSWPAATHKADYKYVQKTVIYKHDHTDSSFDLSVDCTPGAERVWDRNFTVSVVDESEAKEKSDHTVKFSGRVDLPDSGAKKKGTAQPDSD
jgi:hypothetical protein